MKNKKTLLFYILLLATMESSYFIKKKGYRITYQNSLSMPKGFYLIWPTKTLNRGDIAVFYPPKQALTFLLKQLWIPKSGLLMKYVTAIPGDFVCKKNNKIWINNKKIAPVLRYFAQGKLLPNKEFCCQLETSQYLLMSNKIQNSFDGRYFGPTRIKDILGKGTKLSLRLV